MTHQIALQIRSKKLAVLIRDARTVAKRTRRECASALGVTPGIFQSYEEGSRAPSLPELEALAFFLDVPVEHFWGSKALSETGAVEPVSARISKSLDLRQQAIGARLQQMREDAGMSLAELSRKSKISTGALRKFESGDYPVPVPVLEQLATTMNTSLNVFGGGEGPVANWLREKSAFQKLMEMPEDLQEFVCKPVNRPYLEIAQRLSAMEVQKLRTVAEGLLEITL